MRLRRSTAFTLLMLVELCLWGSPGWWVQLGTTTLGKIPKNLINISAKSNVFHLPEHLTCWKVKLVVLEFSHSHSLFHAIICFVAWTVAECVYKVDHTSSVLKQTSNLHVLVVFTFENDLHNLKMPADLYIVQKYNNDQTNQSGLNWLWIKWFCIHFHYKLKMFAVFLKRYCCSDRVLFQQGSCTINDSYSSLIIGSVNWLPLTMLRYIMDI